MTQGRDRIIYWTPRIMAIIFIFFMFLMSLDVISSEQSFRQIMTAMLIHNIPVIIMIILLIISWKFEIVGGIAFIMIGLIYIFMLAKNHVYLPMALSWSMSISGPAFVIGVLFLINWQKKRKDLNNGKS